MSQIQNLKSKIGNPWITLTTRKLFVAILFLALFVMATREISDPDFWWHLRTGQFILETQSIPHVDPFSYTNAGKTWVTHEWLAEVFMFAIYALGSFPALILVFSGIITLVFAFVYARMDGKPYVAAFALMLCALTTAMTWGVRPQMLSLLLMSVFLFILDRYVRHSERSEESRSPNAETLRFAQNDSFNDMSIWLLPLLMILWVNLHSGYALGLVVIGVYLFGEFVSQVSSFKSLFTLYSPLFPLTLTFLLCLLAVLINPNGATMYIYPFETLTSPAMQAYIQEWFSPDFHLGEFQPFAWLMLATLAAVGLSGKRMTLTQVLLLIVFGYAGLRSSRNIPLFAIIAAPILAEHVWLILKERGWARVLSIEFAPSRLMVTVNWVLLAVIALAGLVRIGTVITNQATIERAKFPAAAVDFLQAQKLYAPLYNSYDWGGYLIWRFASRPQSRVFIDGRADVHGDQFIENVYLRAYRGGAGWREPLDQYGVRVVLVEPFASIADQLAKDSAWTKVYEDKQAVIYTR